MLLGPDVSSWQGSNINWQAVANSGRSFAWTKATEADSYTNPALSADWGGIKAAKLVRGAYHFGDPAGDPIAQAEFFVNTINSVGGFQPTDLAALDLEELPTNGVVDGGRSLLQWALDFLGHLQQLTGFTPEIYSGRWFMDPNGIENSDQLAQYPLWLSGYTQNEPQPPGNWKANALWQFTASDNIPGIPGGCDESYYFGTIDDLRALGKPGAAPAHIGDDLVTMLRSTLSSIVTMASVNGDMSYPDGVDIDSQAPGQDPGVTRRVFQRILDQQIKAELGAS